MFASISSLATVKLPVVRDERGALVILEMENNIPFEVRRVFWIFDVPADKPRGGHAHKACHQYFICCCGRIAVEISDGVETCVQTLEEGMGLHIPPATFTTLWFDKPGTVLTVFCDRPYQKDDYIFNRSALKSFRLAIP